ncbi:HAD hydrolase family protein, partial [Megasphaera sp.]
MITIDLDGTLLRSDGSVSDRTVRTLQAARDKGVVVAIATGRMYQTARPYGD